jgi:hypothetical protein
MNGFRQPAAMAADVVAQGLPGLEAHDQVDRFVGAEEIQHAHHVRMVQPGQRAPLLEEQFQAVVEIRLELGGMTGVICPSPRRTTALGMYSLIATGVPAASCAR